MMTCTRHRDLSFVGVVSHAAEADAYAYAHGASEPASDAELRRWLLAVGWCPCHPNVIDYETPPGTEWYDEVAWCR